jgi:hypothetical protein
MIVVLDAGMLTILIHPASAVPQDPKTGEPLERAQERIQHLIQTLESEGATIVIPTPALAEFLVLADDSGPSYLRHLHTRARFDIRAFDEKAAIDCAEAQRQALAANDKRSGAMGAFQKIKVDRQIVAIATSVGADRIYTTDKDVVKIAQFVNLSATPVWDLPLPPVTNTERQSGLFDEDNGLLIDRPRRVRLPDGPSDP